MAQRGEFVRMGGAYFTQPLPQSDPPLKDEEIPYAGSVMVVTAVSEEEVKRRMAEDPYTKGGVWDVEKARIMP